MLNDRKASELISQSFRRELTAAEAQQVNEHLDKDANSRAFARISRVIQNSLADIAVMAESGDESVTQGMPADAKERLRQSVHLAVDRQQTGDSRSGTPRVEADVERDLALASTLLQDGCVTEQQLSGALANWKRQEGVPMAEHLVQAGLVTEELLARCRTKAEELLNSRTVKRSSAEPASSSWSIGETFDVGVLGPAVDVADSHSRIARDSRQLISRFTLIRKLGEGGLGAVWLARDEKLKRTVAIKEMNTAAAESPKAWQRFHREAEITGHLEHPNVVPLYQFGSDPKSGQPFYAMRFVGKRTLADAIVEFHERRLAGDDDALELHRLLTAFIGVCQAVAHAHSRGVIHRDLKPENVALDNFGQVIVLDWGLAKLTDEAELTTQLTIAQDADDSLLARTLAGEVIGTPLYMAPEQASGDLDNVDERTDVYGLGGILFAILTGCAPHENSKTSRGGRVRMEEVLRAIADGDTPAPRDYNAGVPSDLESVCMKAMSRKRYARHASASNLADDVQRWMADRHHKQQQYDNMHMEGRELRANLQSSVRDLCTNVRFMANLPPIQGIMDARTGNTDDEENVWRERLATIYKGLLQANCEFSAIAYCSVIGNEFAEIVRIERHSTDRANVRSVPRSRLAAGAVTEFIQVAMLQKPEEVFVALTTADTESTNPTPESGLRKLSAAVPVFDEQTEDPFGFVVIECELRRIIEAEVRDRIRTAQQVIVLTPDSAVWLHHCRDSGQINASSGRPASDVVHDFDRLGATLARQTEFVDETNRELYATRLGLGRNEPGMVFVLDRRPAGESR